jgi:transposase
VVETVLESRPHPEQGYRSCLGILRLSKHYGKERLDAACRRALEINALSYKSIKSILENGLDRQRVRPRRSVQPPLHGNIRGNGYYQ